MQQGHASLWNQGDRKGGTWFNLLDFARHEGV